MLLYLFFNSLLSTCPKKMENEKWPNAADSPLYCFFLLRVLTRYARVRSSERSCERK